MRSALLIMVMGLWFNSIVANDKIVGVWLTDKDKSKIEIFKGPDGKYYGKIVYLKDPFNENNQPKRDKNNPDGDLRSVPIIGLKLLRDFSYDGEDKKWTDGTIYDPESGKTYSCNMWFEEDFNVLHVKGYLGFAIIGKEVEWRRAVE